ncbi:MAG TPA: hypothetical protein ENJ93_00520 [Chloroflexi bacterium]|nr:hypothetical protein [Chloroflexota bacterium]
MGEKRTGQATTRFAGPKAYRYLIILIAPLLVIGILWTGFQVLAAPVSPDTVITVTTLADSGTGSLRDAILNASAGGTIEFAPDLSGQTIVLSQELTITKDLTIHGNVPITISGGHAARVFQVTAGNVTFDNLVIAHGFVNSSGGGGILLSDASVVVTVTNSIVMSNTAYSGGGIYSRGATTIISGSKLIGNTGSNSAGAFANDFSGAGVIYNSVISENVTFGYSESVYNYRGPLTVTASIFYGSSGDGLNRAGLLNEFGEVAINTTLFLNHSGSGIDNYNGDLTVDNSAFISNLAGIGSSGGRLTVHNSTFSGNTRTVGSGIYNSFSIFRLYNTILANSPNGDDCFSNVELSADAHNLIENNNAANPCGTPISTVDPLLAPLRDNGGATPTLGLLPGSPAIDRGDNATCLSQDQRSVPRPQDGNGDGTAVCDIGAFEVTSHALTISLAGTGDGAVLSIPSGIDCDPDCTEFYAYGTVVTLTAVSINNSVFAGWGGVCSSISAQCVVTMDTDQTVTAAFNTNPGHYLFLPTILVD